MDSTKNRIRRWDVFHARLDPVIGSEQGGWRPVVVISEDSFNATMPIVTVIPLTKLEGKRRSPYRFEVVLPAGVVTPGVTSVVLPYQIRTISKQRMESRVGRITDPVHQAQIEERLLDHLGIED